MRNLLNLFIAVATIFMMGFASVPRADIYEYGLYKKIGDGQRVKVHNLEDKNDFIYTAEFGEWQ